MTWSLVHSKYESGWTAFAGGRDAVVVGEWSDEDIEQIAQKVNPDNTDTGRHGRTLGDYRHIIDTIKEFLPKPIRDKL
jgi:hypothetical protein